MRNAVDIIGWIIIASLVVLMLFNAGSVATVIGASTSALVSESALLTGSGYGTSSYGSIKAA